MARKRRRRGRRHPHTTRRRRNPMGDWMPWVIGAGMGGLITFFYLQTVSSNPQLAAGSTTAAKTS